MNYMCIKWLQKGPEYVTSTLERVTINLEYEVNCHIFTVLFKINLLTCAIIYLRIFFFLIPKKCKCILMYIMFQNLTFIFF